LVIYCQTTSVSAAHATHCTPSPRASPPLPRRVACATQHHPASVCGVATLTLTHIHTHTPRAPSPRAPPPVSADRQGGHRPVSAWDRPSTRPFPPSLSSPAASCCLRDTAPPRISMRCGHTHSLTFTLTLLAPLPLEPLLPCRVVSPARHNTTPYQHGIVFVY